MTNSKFTSLVKCEKWEILWDSGRLIAEITQGKSSFLLFSINTFFVEVEFCAYEEKAQNLYSFTTGNRLDKYLKEIDVCT